MDVVYFGLVAIALYFASNWILERIELAAGHRLESRSLIFFAILLVLTLACFAAIRNYTGNP